MVSEVTLNILNESPQRLWVVRREKQETFALPL